MQNGFQPAPGVGAGSDMIPDGIAEFESLADAWSLSTDQQIKLLGSPGRSTFFNWRKKGGKLPDDTLERISHLVAIYKALQILFPDHESADGWIKRQNAYFGGQTALDAMLSGRFADLYKVREYVDAQRGG